MLHANSVIHILSEIFLSCNALACPEVKSKNKKALFRKVYECFGGSLLVKGLFVVCVCVCLCMPVYVCTLH